jgi:4a-hydroxytetrahydrobiopterin dehydratase
MPALLDDDEIRAALEALPGWDRDDQALVKRVPLADDQHDAVESQVAAVADELDHHPEVSRDFGALTFRLWTHSAGGITAKDVELAGRIDQVLSGSVQE